MRDVLDVIGHFGRWQLFFTFVASHRGILTGLNNLAYVFLITDPDHWCDQSANTSALATEEWKKLALPFNQETGSYSQCTMYRTYDSQTGHAIVDNSSLVPCTSWAYDEHPFGRTLTNEWNLVCDREWMKSLVQSVYMAFLMLGVLVNGVISDRFGRRLTFIANTILLCVGATAAIFSPNLYFFLVSRVGIGLGISGLQVAAFSLLAETIGPNYRIALNITYGYGWSLGMFVLPGIVWLAQDWRKLQIATAVLSFPLIVVLPWIYESPRWLLTAGDKETACAGIKKMAAFNKRPCDDLEKKVEALIEDKLQGHDANRNNISIIGLFQYPLLRRNTIMLVACSMFSFIVYYGVVRSATTIGGNPYFNFTVSTLLETVGYTISLVTTKYFKRRLSIVANYVLFGITLLAMAFTAKEQHALRITLMMAGRLFFTLAFTTKFVFLNEVFPTVARSGGFGMYTTVGRLGATLEPWINLAMASLGESYTLIIYCLMIFCIALICMMLPETYNTVLPDTLEEGEAFCRRRSVRKTKKKDGVDVTETEML